MNCQFTNARSSRLIGSRFAPRRVASGKSGDARTASGSGQHKDESRRRESGSYDGHLQKMNTTDRNITKQIRSAIYKDKSLSTYAHNIKIISQDGKVTLKGPVRTDDEKTSIEAKAAAVVGEGNVTSQLEVAPAKQSQ